MMSVLVGLGGTPIKRANPSCGRVGLQQPATMQSAFTPSTATARKHHCTQPATFVVLLLVITTFPHHYQTQDVDLDDDSIRKDDDNATTACSNRKQNEEILYELLRKTDTSTRVIKNCGTYTDNESTTNATTTNNNVTNLLTNNKVTITSESEKLTNKTNIGNKLTLSIDDYESINYKGIFNASNSEKVDINIENRKLDGPEQKEIDEAVEYGLKRMHDLYFVKEPELYRMGLFLEKNHPGYFLASFRTPNEKALRYARYGYAAVQAKTRLAELYPESLSRESPATTATLRSDLLLEECPLQGLPRCPSGFRRYRTADGTCNNLKSPWRGASMLPMQRFLPPHFHDGIQAIRKSVTGRKLPSPRDISTRIHRDKNREMPTITLMFMQWGQFLDHDVISSVQARMFNRSVPRCCQEGGRGLLPPEFTHPECLPITVSENDRFLSQFGIRCIEFVRSAPTTRIDCDLGFREQISQVTAYIDASTVYGSDPETADSLRLFRKGQLVYGRARSEGPLQPPDPPEGELCRLGAVTTDCFRGGDLRVGDQPGLTALHTVWLRYHNRVAFQLAKMNSRWSDEKVYQEARRIVGALIQHITYREFLPIVLGEEVMRLFGLNLERTGYYKGYNPKVNPTPANSFGTAAFRFGHSLVQNSFVRRDSAHRIIRNNVTLHEEQSNVENLWSFGSMDRLLLGLCDQPTQRRDEFISKELTNHLFQTSGFSFGMDLAAINIQRGRDHGLPSYTAWREPCGLIPLRNWTDFNRIMSSETVQRFKSLYEHFDDIDLFSGGLAERPVRGGIVGPTFACIIAQQFSNLRRGDRFWYENGNFESSFTPAQLQQIRKITFAHVLCKTTNEIETIQPFVFLSADASRNVRVPCDDPIIDNFDLSFWKERHPSNGEAPLDPSVFLRRSDDNFDESLDEVEEDDEIEDRENSNRKRRKPRPKTKTTRAPVRRKTTTKLVTRLTRPTAYVNNRPVGQNVVYKPFKVKVTNISTATVNLKNKKNKYGRPTSSVQKRPIARPVTVTRPIHVYSSSQRPILVKKPAVDGYLIDHVSSNGAMTSRPTSVTYDKGPYQVNINIQLIPTNGQVQDSNKFGYENHPMFSTRQTTPMTHIKVQSTRQPIHVTESYDYSQNRPSGYNNFVTSRPSRPIMRPQSGYDNFFDPPLTVIRPLHRPSTETVFENVPFATSSKPDTDTYNYHKISTMRPVIIPSYLYLNEQDEDAYSYYQQTSKPMYSRPTNLYKTDEEYDSIDNYDVTKSKQKISKLHQDKEEVSLEDEDTKGFIKISSVQGHKDATLEEMKSPIYISAQQKEGELELSDEVHYPNFAPLVKVDITPSEDGVSEWIAYNEINDTFPDIPDIYDLIDFNKNETCTNELPQPIKLNEI
ncbi:hypothetical protein ILUMI_09939 [Ignelater luminosus]|uniref:Chorion peroxidase n=1 Tax=Ignelater luminosus TaxID=2038154 RepID=A0A8K0GFG7_IGNLU|nr:hypothetical protein ILUMI_09939 [Ignelater luminosus]